ncbi:hypothetical protein M0804_013994 [Polistes exclamans]|nr:hypothetical protein M0804_013997 [Polistes exclamans]KAI4475934.1 hypothetical protein M0804_013994 [Polistes exclamans]
MGWGGWWWMAKKVNGTNRVVMLAHAVKFFEAQKREKGKVGHLLHERNARDERKQPRKKLFRSDEKLCLPTVSILVPRLPAPAPTPTPTPEPEPGASQH